MLTYERQLEIMEIIKKNQVVTVDYLSKKLFASPATIRRDLSDMEKKGLLKRIHGGATIFESTAADAPLLLRTKKETDKKRRIAELALPLVASNSIIFMDSSSTVTMLATLFDRFTDKNIITNGLVTANVLNEKTDNNVYLTGGQIVGNSSLIGNFGIKMAESINADLCFFSCCGFDTKGTTEAKENIGVFKEAMVRNARKNVLLCDSTKFSHSYFCNAIDISCIDTVVTDKKPADEFLALNVEFIY